MGKQYDSIEAELQEFIEQQKLFFVATAPLESEGLINLSPKGLDSMLVLDSRTVAYADLTGSGIETVAHLRQNGRITLMFCAFEGPPKIVRLHGQGQALFPKDSDFDSLADQFGRPAGLRSVIRVACHRVSTSCGFGVPFMAFQGERSQLPDFYEKKGIDGVRGYWAQKNRTSIEGLPGVDCESVESP